MSDKFWTSEWSPVFRALDAGKCPVLISGVGASSRAHAAAAMRRQLGFPLFVVCPDDQAVEIMARDLENLLGEQAVLVPARDLNLFPADSVSRGEEQKRLAALAALEGGGVNICVCSVTALCQRTMPMELLRKASLTVSANFSTLPTK